MADKTVRFVVVGEDKSASKTLKGVGDEAEKAGGRLSRMGEIAGGVLGADLLRSAGTAVVEFGKQSVTAFMDAEKSQRQLEDAYARFPQVQDVPIQKFRELNEAIQAKTGADADDLASSQAVMAQYGLTGQQLAELTPLLDDYALKTGKDLPTAAEDLGKAMLGQGRALKDVGIDFSDAGSVAGNFEQVMGGLRSQVAGFAEGEADSADGKLRQLQTSFGDVQEEVGSQLLPVLVQLGEGLLGVIGWIKENTDILGPLAVAVGVAAVALAAMNVQQGIMAAGGLVNFIKAWAAEQAILNLVMSMNPIALVVIAIAALVAGLIVAYNTSEDFRRIVDGALQGVMDTGRRVGDFFMVDVPRFFSDSANAVGSAFSGVKDQLLAPIKSAVQWINDTFVSGINGFLGVIGISWRVPQIPGFAEGGYTGPGGRLQPAGVVHAGEVVWSQDDVAAWGGPSAVDGMRQARGVTPSDFLPGFAGGGIVPNATQGFAGYYAPALAAMQAWAGASGRTWSMTGIGGARTYAQQWAAYQNYLAGGNLAADPRKGLGPHMVPAIAMDLSPRPGDIPAARALLGSFGLGLPVPGEPWHVQYLAGRGGGGATTGGAIDFGIGGIIAGLLAKAPGLAPPWGDVIKAVMGKVGGGLTDKVMGLFGFDDGGWMMPGTLGFNSSKTPEPVFSGVQWDILKQGVGAGLDADALAEKVGASVARHLDGMQLPVVGIVDPIADVITLQIKIGAGAS